MGEAPIDRGRGRGWGWGWGWTLRLVVLALALALVVVLIAANFVVVEVRLVAWAVETRLAWALLASAAVGLAAGLVLPRPWRRG